MQLTQIFPKIEEQEYQRSKKTLNTIPIGDSVIGKPPLPRLIFDTTKNERKEIKIPEYAQNKDYIIVRRFDIKD